MSKRSLEVGCVRWRRTSPSAFGSSEHPVHSRRKARPRSPHIPAAGVTACVIIEGEYRQVRRGGRRWYEPSKRVAALPSDFSGIPVAVMPYRPASTAGGHSAINTANWETITATSARARSAAESDATCSSTCSGSRPFTSSTRSRSVAARDAASGCATRAASAGCSSVTNT